MASIYGLTDPKTGEVRYIGKANDPEKRLAGHMRDMTRRNTPLYCWMRKNGKPGLVVLSENCQDWKSEERRIIAEYRAASARLLNVADGGDEPFCSKDVRARNGAIVAAKRSRVLWSVYRRLGYQFKYFSQRGDEERALKMKAATEMLKAAEAKAIKLNRLSDLEHAVMQSRLAVA